VLTLVVVPAILALFPNKHAKKTNVQQPVDVGGVAVMPVAQAALNGKVD
jgi:hypothetical protein